MFRDRANLIILFIAVLGAVGGFTLSRALSPAPAAEETNASTGTSSSEAPAIELPDTNGELRRLADWQGDYVLINFWATWCAPCRKEMPELSRFREAHKDQGFETLGIAIDKLEPAAAMAAELNVHYPILITDMTGAMPLMSAFGNDAGVLPFSVLIDPQGEVSWVRLGEVTYEDLIELLEARLAAIN